MFEYFKALHLVDVVPEGNDVKCNYVFNKFFVEFLQHFFAFVLKINFTYYSKVLKKTSTDSRLLQIALTQTN